MRKSGVKVLNPRASRVFLVGEDSLGCCDIPFLLAYDRQDVPNGQFLGNLTSHKPFKEKLKDEPHDLDLLLVDGEIAVLAFVVDEKARVADGELAVGELFCM